MRQADYKLLIISGSLLFTIGCNTPVQLDKQKRAQQDLPEEDPFVDTLKFLDYSIIDSANLNNSRQHYFFDLYDLSLIVPEELALDNYSDEYYEYSTHEELSAKFIVFADRSLEDKKLPLTNKNLLDKLTISLAHISFDRKEILQINGVKFVLLMGHNYVEALDETEYFFTLARPVGEHIIRFRFNDASTRYNYTQEEALDQMRATANQLLASIRVKIG